MLSLNSIYVVSEGIFMNSTKSKINDLAEKIINQFVLPHPLTVSDFKKFIEECRGLLSEDSQLPISSSGTIEKIEDNKFKITIPENEPETRKKFTIAHELGHLFLHMQFLSEEKWLNTPMGCLYNRSGSNSEEYEANEFAAALLMPRKIYKDQLEKTYAGNGRYNIAEVADYFDVSLEAARNRGRWLNLLAW